MPRTSRYLAPCSPFLDNLVAFFPSKVQRLAAIQPNLPLKELLWALVSGVCHVLRVSRPSTTLSADGKSPFPSTGPQVCDRLFPFFFLFHHSASIASHSVAL